MMASTRLFVLAIILQSLSLVAVFAAKEDCKSLVQQYLEFNRQQLAPYGTHELLYVLRTPQTNSLELDSCLIRAGMPGTQRCPSFHEVIRTEAFKKLKGCSVLSSHDDLSILDKLTGKVAVAAQLSDPVQRLVGAYELAVEVAVQQLQLQTKSKNPFEAMQLQHPQSEHVPWSQLYPFLLKDLVAKKAKIEDEDDEDDDITAPAKWVAKHTNDGKTTYVNSVTDEEKDTLTAAEKEHLLPDLDPYNNKLIMSLEEFVAHPKVEEQLHNGELFQVLGLTNVSKWEQAPKLRKCIQQDAAIAAELYSFAVQRLESFAYVGIADDVHSSVELAAATLGISLDDHAYVPGEKFIPGVKTIKMLSFSAGMKPGEGPASATKEVEVEGHSAETIEDVKALIEEKEAEAQKLYDVAYDLFQKGSKDKQVLMAARAKVSAAKGAVMQLKHDLEQMEAQKDLDKKMEHNLATEFLKCQKRIHDAGEKQTAKAIGSMVLPDGRQLMFTKEGRSNIPEDALAEIKRLNALDIKLYEHAKQLVQKRQQALESAGKLKKLQALAVPDTEEKASATPKTEEL